MIEFDPGSGLSQGIEHLAACRFADAALKFEDVLRESPDHPHAAALLRYALSIKSDDYFAKISDPQTDGTDLLKYAQLASSRLPRPTKRVLRPGPRRPGRIRLGFLSQDFRRHACAFFMRSLFVSRDRTKFEFHCFADFNETKRDQLSDWFQNSADHWTETTHMNMPQLAAVIAKAGIDVLVDIGGYSFGSTVSVCAYKPAKKIVSWLGFPASTGIPEIGYRIGDPVSDPAGIADAHFSEKIVRLDGPFICFSPEMYAPQIAPLPEGEIVFGSFNAHHKINIPVAKLWAHILKSVPNSRLLLKCNLRDDPAIEPYLHGLLSIAGVPLDRLSLLPLLPDIRSHLETYSRVHVALDTFPYNGTTTTCEALWMGVPVVALRGKRHAARVGASLLQHAGLRELVAETPDEYAAKAIMLANDHSRLATYRSSLRTNLAMTPVFDAAAWTRLFETGIMQIFLDRVHISGTTIETKK